MTAPPLRLLQAIGGARHGGAEEFFLRLTLALHRAGQDQLILLRHESHAETLRRAGVVVRVLPFGGLLDLSTKRGLRRAIAEYRPAVVLSWMSRASRLCPRGEFVHVARLGGYYDLKYYRGCDHLVGNTRDIVAKMIAQGWPADRAHYLPNFVDATPAPAVPRETLATPPDATLALALGRLHDNKGFDVLLTAVAQVPKLHLWLAGTGDLASALERQARALGIADRVRFLGWRADVAGLLAAADMVVVPSRREPLGNVVIEAWAAGRPVVAAASVGPRNLIADGDSGLLVPVDDAMALGAALARVAADCELRRRLVAGGRAAYEAEFTERAVVARYQDFFAEIAIPAGVR
ncbi:MAG: putative glycosyltransferase [Rhodospirillales bacterium]|nr:putative glycosyltransferase [Rhodospirillales bacterium]